MNNHVNILGWDRTIAFLIIDGKVYESEVNHQDCFLYYCRDIGHDLKNLLDNEEEYFNMLDDLIERTYKMKCSHDAYGFDMFTNDKETILVAHDRETLLDNKHWVKRCASEHEAKVGVFTDHWNVEIIKEE